jgi:diacylglycerol kinase family enzyme
MCRVSHARPPPRVERRSRGRRAPPPYAARVPSRHPVRYVDHRVGDKRLQRTAAATSLLLGVVGVGCLVWFALGRPVHLVLLVVGGLGVLFFGFTALTSTGVHRLIAALGALAAVAAITAGTVLRAISEAGIRWSGVAGLTGLVAAVALGRYALRVPPPKGDALWAVPDGGPTSRWGVLIANPRSGGGKVAQFGIVDLAREHGIEVVVLEADQDLRAVAEEAVARGADALGMAGGDGSLSIVAEACVRHDVPFVCVPAGTRNHYAMDLGLDRADPRGALAAFVNGEEHRVDHATVNGRLFLNNVSLGVYAAAVEKPEYRDAKVETTLNLLPELVAQGGPWFDLHFDVPGNGRMDAAALVQVSNNAYEMAGPNFGRRLHLDGGELGIVVVDVGHVSDLVTLTVLAAARHPERAAGVWPWTTERFVVDSPQRELGLGIDGEHVRMAPPLEFCIVPQGLRVLVPTGTAIGLAAQHLGAHGTVSGLLEVAFNIGAGPPGD